MRNLEDQGRGKSAKHIHVRPLPNGALPDRKSRIPPRHSAEFDILGNAFQCRQCPVVPIGLSGSSRVRSQARRLDKYLYRKSRQAAGKIGINETDLRKSAARNRVTYLEKVKKS